MSGLAGWATYGRTAAADRLALGRSLGDSFVDELDDYCRDTCKQTGDDVAFALLALHIGLYGAHAANRNRLSAALSGPSERLTPAAACDATSPAWLKPADGLTALVRHLRRAS